MQCEKRIQIEKILSTAFYAANYAGLNEPFELDFFKKVIGCNIPLVTFLVERH